MLRAIARALIAVLCALLVATLPSRGRAQEPERAPPAAASAGPAAPGAGAAAPPVLAGEAHLFGADVPELDAPPDLGDLAGKPIRRIEVVSVGGRWASSPTLTSVRLGEPLSLEAARRAMRELLATGGFARATVDARPEGDGAALLVRALPRRTIATIQMSGGALDRADTLQAADVAEGGEITAPRLETIAARIRSFYASHGFTAADVTADTADTDDRTRVVLSIEIEAGAPRTISQRVFVVEPRADAEIGDLKTRYRVGSGDRVDEAALAEADRDLTEELRKKAFYRADVRHALRHVGPLSYLYVYLRPGPRIVPVFDGNRAVSSEDLEDALGLEKPDQWKPGELAPRIRIFYESRGFLDAEVTAVERGAPEEPVHYMAFTIREHAQVRVVRRVFPCLGPPMTADEVGKEIESFLEEELPSDDVSLPDPRSVGRIFGPTEGSGGRAAALDLNPAMTYAPETYDRALKHLRDLFASKGYLNAVVGPVTVMRATCSPRSPAGRCIPMPPPARVVAQCKKDALGLPVPEPEVPEGMMCKPDPKRGIECAPEITLRIPVHLGPQTTLYDLAFEGNRSFTEARLGTVTELTLGGPLSNVELEAARLRVLDLYKDFGFAYAEVRTAIDTSPDRTRARVRFLVTERDPVTVTGFVVSGNVRTDEGLILGRVALRKDRPYRQDLVRLTEERIATLGTFSSVTVGLEDPEVPQKNKRVVIKVVEQMPQYLDPLIGFSTGEGLRFGFEYGHRNIAGLAISFTLRVQLGFLFDFMILDADARANYDKLTRGTSRLERRDSATIAFPEIGLGPLISLAFDAIDLNDLQRDFRVEKQTVIPTFTYRPRRQIATQLGASVEYNDVEIFRAESGFAGVPAFLRAPQGCTFVLGQRLSVSWDRRDTPLAATKGTFVAIGTEHVNAFPAGTCHDVDATIKSHFLRLTGRVAGYIRLTPKGTALALSLAGGYNLQLDADSQTYPDRLFFLGGVDSIRAFLSDSLVPEDVAQRILNDDNLTIKDVIIRGGDVALNPRVELRVPLNDTFQLGLFLDAGNLWLDPSEIDLLALRIGPGAGLRISTPIGPLALDYGFNVIRRDWEEDPGAFHFSIGLF